MIPIYGCTAQFQVVSHARGDQALIERFRGEEGHRRLVAALSEHRLLGGIDKVAERLALAGTLQPMATGDVFISQGATDTDVFFIVAGAADIVVNGKHVAIRHAGDHVGETSMALLLVMFTAPFPFGPET